MAKGCKVQGGRILSHGTVTCVLLCLLILATGHTLVESTLFPCHFNEITLNQRGIDVDSGSCVAQLVEHGACNARVVGFDSHRGPVQKCVQSLWIRMTQMY